MTLKLLGENNGKETCASEMPYVWERVESDEGSRNER
jgi:hypothetical protein